ncbi:MAG: hypothetical protein ACLRFF_01240 [Alphaproteobacteria bacterium]
MKRQTNTICIRNVIFHKINKQTFDTIDLSDLQFFIVSRSGLIDTPRNMYFFTSTKAFFMNQSKNTDNFLSTKIPGDWKKINLFFCDDLFINPKIYNSFARELCAKNIRDFWFQTAIDIFKDKAWKLHNHS